MRVHLRRKDVGARRSRRLGAARDCKIANRVRQGRSAMPAWRSRFAVS
jgi:hypothetical protein